MDKYDSSTNLKKSGRDSEVGGFVPVVKKTNRSRERELESVFRHIILDSCCKGKLNFDEARLDMPHNGDCMRVIPFSGCGYEYKNLKFEDEIHFDSEGEIALKAFFNKLLEANDKFKRIFVSFCIKKIALTLILCLSVVLCSVTGVTLVKKIGIFASVLIPIITVIGFIAYLFMLTKSFEGKIDKVADDLKSQYESEISEFNWNFAKEFNMELSLGYKGYWIIVEFKGIEEQIDMMNNNTSLSYSLYSITDRTPKTVPCSEEKINSFRKQHTSSLVPPLCIPPTVVKCSIPFPDDSVFIEKEKNNFENQRKDTDKDEPQTPLPTVPDEEGVVVNNRECVRLSFLDFSNS